MATEDLSKQSEDSGACTCPFCDGVIDVRAPWCATCEVKVSFCEACQEPLPVAATECPKCGAECEA